jgi:chemotaxis protein methyltransferase CheR
MLVTPEADIHMSSEEFVMIRDYIHETSGIFFAENKSYLVRNRLSRRMAELGLRSVMDYYYHIKYDSSLTEFNRLMDLITTNETSFYRNEPQLMCFSDEVLPKMLKHKEDEEGKKTLRIWSAGCSTGEEPYTLGILVLEKGLPARGWNVEIMASDISERVLREARSGEYSAAKLKVVRPDLVARYFTREGDTYQVRPSLRSLVKFSQLNLNDELKVSTLGSLDAVFCRNVMIYFSDEVKKRLVRSFYNLLKPGGYLYIGHSETLHGISKAFKLVYFKSALVYQKEQVVKHQSQGTFSKAATTTAGPTATVSDAATSARKAEDLLKKIRSTAAGTK